MGLLSKVGEGVGSVGGMLAGMVGDITKAGGGMLARIFRAGDPPGEDPIGLDGIGKAASSAIDRTTGLAQKGLEGAGKMAGQAGDDMLMALASPKTPAMPGFDDKSKGIG